MRRRRRHFPTYYEGVFWFTLAGFFGMIAILEQSAWRVAFGFAFVLVVAGALWWFGIIYPDRAGRP